MVLNFPENGLSKMNARQRNNARVIGRGKRTLLFGHGFGCDQTMWRHITPAFEMDSRMVLFDHVGSGRAQASGFSKARYTTMHDYAKDLVELIDEMDLKEIHFVGHSVSSMIGALAAIARPERFASLTMIGPSPCYLNDGEYRGGFDRGPLESLLKDLESNHVVWSATMAPLIMGKSSNPMLSAEFEACLCRMDPEMAHHFAQVIFYSDLRAEVPKVPVPVLLLQCVDDIVVPPYVGAHLERHLPDSRTVRMGAPGHCPHMSSPGEVIAAVRVFLESVEEARASVDGSEAVRKTLQRA